MASFRSKLLGGAYFYGPFTTFPTYNPSESHSDAVMRLGGSPFGYDAAGRPDDGYPDSTRRLQIVAGRPAACAVFFQSVIAAVEKVAYGWAPGDKQQTDQDCLFGKVRIWTAWLVKASVADQRRSSRNLAVSSRYPTATRAYPAQVAVYAKKTETGGRGGLHDHHLVLSDALQPGNFDRLMQSDDDAMFRSVL
jgi:hypothetical protein